MNTYIPMPREYPSGLALLNPGQRSGSTKIGEWIRWGRKESHRSRQEFLCLFSRSQQMGIPPKAILYCTRRVNGQFLLVV